MLGHLLDDLLFACRGFLLTNEQGFGLSGRPRGYPYHDSHYKLIAPTALAIGLAKLDHAKPIYATGHGILSSDQWLALAQGEAHELANLVSLLPASQRYEDERGKIALLLDRVEDRAREAHLIAMQGPQKAAPINPLRTTKVKLRKVLGDLTPREIREWLDDRAYAIVSEPSSKTVVLDLDKLPPEVRAILKVLQPT